MTTVADPHPVVKAVASLISHGNRAIVALSGGADSVALAAAMVEVGIDTIAIHCNYHLRGAESDRDEAHARKIAQSLGIDIITVNCDVEAYRRRHPATSIEMACRELRYDIFRHEASSRGIDTVAVAHHLEDNIETLLLNLLRGSGVKGLAAMSPRRGIIARPLLNITKQEIIDYLRLKQLDFVTDSSNLSNDYRRNAIRNEILPTILKYFPSASQGLQASLSALASQRLLQASIVSQARARYVDTDGNIDLSSIIACEPAPAELLFEILNHPDYNGFTTTTVANIINSANKSGLSFYGHNGIGYRLEHGMLNAIRIYGTFQRIVFDKFTSPDVADFFSVEFLKPAGFRPARDTNVTYFDAEQLEKAGPFTLRQPETGDRMRPFGLKGTKLLSDIFAEKKLTYNDRTTTPVVTDARGHIIWLPGIRSSAHYPVTPTTNSILKITFR